MNEDNTKKDGEKKGHLLSTGLGFAVAMALGATLGVLFAPKEGTETQKDIAEKAMLLAKKFNKSRKEVQAAVKDIFGEVTEELEKNYLELQGEILASIDDIKDIKELTENKYDQIVQDVVKHFSKGKKWTEKAIKNLIEELKKDWTA